MSETKFTKNLAVSSSVLVVERDTAQIAANCLPIGVPGLNIPAKEAVANALLFAAAPDLYAALEKASAAARRTAARISDEHGIAARLWEGMADDFDAVLKKARGE
jgi:hypothetical protein